jgi:hypothetical protein
MHSAEGHQSYTDPSIVFDNLYADNEEVQEDDWDKIK